MSLIATVTMNPAVDVFTSADRVEPVRKLRCRGQSRDPGGGGINIARVAHRLGGLTTAIYPAGGLVGSLLEQLVQAEGIPAKVVRVAGETREDFTVFDESAGKQYRFILPGPRLRGMEWMECLRVVANLDTRPALLCASGSLPPGVPDDFYVRLAEIASGYGARFVLDASGLALQAAARDAHIHLIKPNLNELRELAGERLETDDDMFAACRALVTSRRIDAVALTLAERGALLVTRDRAWRIRPPNVPIVGSVGAGDSFLGGMAWAMARGEPIEEAFRYGVAAGTAAVLAPGTELSRAADIGRLVPQMVLEADASVTASS